MNSAAIWLSTLLVALVIEGLARVRTSKIATLSRTSSLVARRITGRAVLLLLWVFVGVHLFARYTIPHG